MEVRASSTNFPERRSAQGGGAALDAETCGGSRQATVASGASCSPEQRSWVGAEPGRRDGAREKRFGRRKAPRPGASSVGPPGTIERSLRSAFHARQRVGPASCNAARSSPAASVGKAWDRTEGVQPAEHPGRPQGDSHRQGREGCGRSRAAQGREAARSPSAPLDWIRPHHWISRWAGNPAG